MIQELTPENSGDWQEWLDANQPEAHLLQTAEWGLLKASFGWQAYTWRQADCGAMVLVRRLPLGFKLGYIPMGPLGEWLPDSLPDLEQISHQLGLFALKIEPDPRDTTATPARLRQSGFVASPHEIQPRRSLVVDLTGSEDDIMMEMHSKTRYNIRYSGRKGVEVKPSSEVAVFTKMMSATADRQEFGVHVPRYYQIAYDLFHPRGNCELFLAEYEGMPLAGLMVFARGSRSWYFYGASTTEERNRMPTYGLQWAAMRWAKERGCTSYDLWGVPDAPEEELEQNFTDRQDGLWGVYRFKRGFGGKLVRSVGAWDLRLNPWIYPPYRRLAGWLFR